MNKYKIVFVKKDFQNFVNCYPDLLRKLLIDEKSMFDTKQLNLVFENTENYIDYFKRNLFLRDDYTYFHGLHRLDNEITNETITFIINQFDIEVIENDKMYIIFEYLRNYSSNFYMFDI